MLVTDIKVNKMAAAYWHLNDVGQNVYTQREFKDHYNALTDKAFIKNF